MLLAGWTATRLAVLRGSAAGLDPTPLALLGLPDEPVLRALALTDLDGDGHLDLALLCAGGAPRLVLAAGLGDGSFLDPPLELPAGVDSPACLLVADFDGDHALDVLVGDGQPTAVGKLALHRGDADGDGHPEVFAISQTDPGSFKGGEVWTLHAVGRDPTPRAELTAGLLTRLLVTDVDRDGRLDLLGNQFVGGDVTVALGGAPRLFREPVRQMSLSVRDLCLADVDLDGDLDVVGTSGPADGAVLVFAGQGDGSLAAPTVLAPGRHGWTTQVGDIDQDGWPDIAATVRGVPGGTYPDDEVLVLLGQGGGSFAGGVASPIDSLGQGLQLADLEGDGLLDAVVNTSDGLRVLPGLGGAAFGPVVLHPDPTTGYLDAPFVMADLDGDVNGDGAQDVLCNGVLLGFGDGGFAPRQPGGPAGAVGDWDRDGDLDSSDSGWVFLNQAR